MSYTEYLRRKAAAAPVVVSTRSKLDASSYTNKVRLAAAGAVFNAPSSSSTTVTVGSNIPVISGPYGPSLNWTSIASSADGTKLAATVGGGRIQTSTNSGLTWTNQTSAPVANWSSITSSADGTKLAACVTGGQIYTSTNSGGTWNGPYAAIVNWNSITSSSDGTKLAACVNGGGIYTSTDSGVTWNGPYATTQNWKSITSSSDGTKLAACVGSGGIYTSTNSGASWNITSAPSLAWYSITSSADGTKLAACVNAGSGQIYTSSNSGLTWTAQTGAPSVSWDSIASSADGTKLAASVNGTFIYVSADSGVTWNTSAVVLYKFWVALASSADGLKVAAVENGGGSAGQVYTVLTSTTTTTTVYQSSPRKSARVPDASVFTSYAGGQAVGKEVQAGMPADRLLLNSNDAGSLSGCVTIPAPVAPFNASSFTKSIVSCHQTQGEKHNTDATTHPGPSVFVDNTITHVKNYNLPQNKTKYQIAPDCVSCGGNPAGTGVVCAMCTGAANHAPSADMPHNTRWGARPKKSAQPVIVAPSPSDARKVGAALRHIPYVEKHHGNANIGHIQYPETPFQIPAGTAAHLKINDPMHYPGTM